MYELHFVVIKKNICRHSCILRCVVNFSSSSIFFCYVNSFFSWKNNKFQFVITKILVRPVAWTIVILPCTVCSFSLLCMNQKSNCKRTRVSNVLFCVCIQTTLQPEFFFLITFCYFAFTRWRLKVILWWVHYWLRIKAIVASKRIN